MYVGMFSGIQMLIILISTVITIWAQAKIKSTYRRYSKIRNVNGVTGAAAAHGLMRTRNLTGVSIEKVAGQLTDHYDPRSQTLRLSDGVYQSDSIAAVAIAAHEVGHVMQHQQGYSPLKIRNSMVPVAGLGSKLAWPLVIFGLIFQFQPLIQWGIYMFAAVVLFQVVTLPVEINASRRALAALESGGYLQTDEMPGARKVLTSAALTYIAAAAVALLNLFRLLLLSRNR
ncbi:zinc metallopeptidase [bacterium]|nr:zinc metallopeptidase [bacterium]